MTDRQLVDVSAMIAAIVGAQRGRYNYFAEMETAGKCLSRPFRVSKRSVA